MKQKMTRLALLMGAMVLATGAQAALTYGNLDTAGFTSSSTPGYQDAVYMGGGGGVTNGNWTVNTIGTLEMGLRAKNRGTFDGDGSSGTYTFGLGLCNPVCSGGAKAMWNYEFSVNTRAGGIGTVDLTSRIVEVRVDTDGTALTAFTAWTDVTTNWGDNSYWDGADEGLPGTAGPSTDEKRVGTGPASAGEFGVQQSANPLFGNSLFQPGFDPFASGLYRIEMRVRDSTITTGNSTLGEVGINVQVPEPSSLALVGLAIAGLGFASRRKA